MLEGREVTVIEESPKLGNGIGIIDRKPQINSIKQRGATCLTNTKLIGITKQGAQVKNTETGEESLIACDTVLLSLGVEENRELYEHIRSAFPQAQLIGDATCPRGTVTRTLEAINAGYQVGMAV